MDIQPRLDDIRRKSANGKIACAMCGKSLSKQKATEGAPVVQGQKFSAK